MKTAFCGLLTAVCLTPSIVFGQVPFPDLPKPVAAFSYEDKDWGIDPTKSLKGRPHHAPTPVSIPGARTIKTLELKALLESRRKIVIVDVLSSKTRESIPGAVWMRGAGDHRFGVAEKERFSGALAKFAEGNKKQPLVFLCWNAECWLSYNASLHAIEAGYEDVIWYRGGTEAWKGANLELQQPEPVDW